MSGLGGATPDWRVRPPRRVLGCRSCRSANFRRHLRTHSLATTRHHAVPKGLAMPLRTAPTLLLADNTAAPQPHHGTRAQTVRDPLLHSLGSLAPMHFISSTDHSIVGPRPLLVCAALSPVARRSYNAMLSSLRRCGFSSNFAKLTDVSLPARISPCSLYACSIAQLNGLVVENNTSIDSSDLPAVSG